MSAMGLKSAFRKLGAKIKAAKARARTARAHKRKAQIGNMIGEAEDYGRLREFESLAAMLAALRSGEIDMVQPRLIDVYLPNWVHKDAVSEARNWFVVLNDQYLGEVVIWDMSDGEEGKGDGFKVYDMTDSRYARDMEDFI